MKGKKEVGGNVRRRVRGREGKEEEKAGDRVRRRYCIEPQDFLRFSKRLSTHTPWESPKNKGREKGKGEVFTS